MPPRMKIIKCYCGNREYHTAACRNTNIRYKQKMALAMKRRDKINKGLCNYTTCRKKREIKIKILMTCPEHSKIYNTASTKRREKMRALRLNPELTKDLLIRGT